MTFKKGIKSSTRFVINMGTTIDVEWQHDDDNRYLWSKFGRLPDPIFNKFGCLLIYDTVNYYLILYENRKNNILKVLEY